MLRITAVFGGDLTIMICIVTDLQPVTLSKIELLSMNLLKIFDIFLEDLISRKSFNTLKIKKPILLGNTFVLLTKCWTDISNFS